MATEHPFYCHKKKCAKSAAATPEYLTAADWQLVERAIATLEANDRAAFNAVLHAGDAKAFFQRIIAWTEGYAYYFFGSETAQRFYFPGFVARELSMLKAAVSARHGELFAAAVSVTRLL